MDEAIAEPVYDDRTDQLLADCSEAWKELGYAKEVRTIDAIAEEPAQVAEESAPSANESEEVIMTQLVRHTTNTAERRKAEKKARAARRAEQDSGRHKVDTAEKRAAERR